MKNADDMAARALEVASTALGRMEQHERECLATRQEIKTGMARLHARMDKIIWAILGVVAMAAWELFAAKIGM